MEFHEQQFGLYVTLEDDGYIKRTLISETGEKDLPFTSIQDEVILFSELNFEPYAAVIDIIQNIADQLDLEDKETMTTEEKEIFNSFCNPF